MKGAMANPERQIYQSLLSALYQGTTYYYNSGGEPIEIPNLTYENLRGFHSRFYHPSNARFFSYGDLPLEPTLQFIQEQALQRFQMLPANAEVPNVPRFSHPQTIETICAPKPGVDNAEGISTKPFH